MPGGTVFGVWTGMRQTAARAIDKPSRIEAEVRRARELVQKQQFAAALAAAESLLRQVPENRDVLYLIAVSQRYLGRTADALATLARFENIHPDYGRLFQERGHCLRAADPAAAVVAYRQAVFRNHTLVASWRALSELLRQLGETAEAGTAAAHIQALTRLPKEVVAATSMFAEGELSPAEQLIRQYLLRHPKDVEAMRLLAQIGVKLDVLDDAEFLLESVLTFAPDYNAARYEYATVLSKRHKYQQALEQIHKLQALEPDNRAFRTIEGNAYVGLGDHARALRIFQQLGAETPD